MRVDVDHFGLMVASSIWIVASVAMNVTMEKIFRPKPAHKWQKSLKPVMWQIVKVMDTEGGSVCDENIEESAEPNFIPQQSRPKVVHCPQHLPLCVHDRAIRPIAYRSFQPSDQNSLVIDTGAM